MAFYVGMPTGAVLGLQGVKVKCTVIISLVLSIVTLEVAMAALSMNDTKKRLRHKNRKI